MTGFDRFKQNKFNVDIELFHFMYCVYYYFTKRHKGSSRHNWCFKYEGKHKEIKMYTHMTSSQKNITLTLAKKYHYKFGHSLLQPSTQEVILKQKHKIISLNVDKIRTTLAVSSSHFVCNNQIKCCKNYLYHLFKKKYC